jgi:antitoxin component of MazEF toxin-antitoxin module
VNKLIGYMERKIVELGGSLVITIPKTLTEIHDLKSRSEVWDEVKNAGDEGWSVDPVSR